MTAQIKYLIALDYYTYVAHDNVHDCVFGFFLSTNTVMENIKTQREGTI